MCVLLYHCLCYRVAVCCGAVYKSESHNLILIDVAKFKPCQQRHHGTLAHFTTVARNAEMTDNGSRVFISSSYNSTDSLSTQDSDLDGHCNSKPDEDAYQSTLFPSSAAASREHDKDEDNDYEDDDSYSVLQTDESMDAASPSRDTDEETETVPASTMAGTHRSILCNLLWNSSHNRPFSKTNGPDNQSSFVWSEMQPQSVSMWPATHALSKTSPVKVFP